MSMFGFRERGQSADAGHDRTDVPFAEEHMTPEGTRLYIRDEFPARETAAETPVGVVVVPDNGPLGGSDSPDSDRVTPDAEAFREYPGGFDDASLRRLLGELGIRYPENEGNEREAADGLADEVLNVLPATEGGDSGSSPVSRLMDKIRRHPRFAVPVAAFLLTISTAKEAKGAGFKDLLKDVATGNLQKAGIELVNDVSSIPRNAYNEARDEARDEELRNRIEAQQTLGRQREREALARRSPEDFRVGISKHQMEVQQICDEFDLQFERWSISSFSTPAARNEQALRIYRDYRMRIAQEQARLNTFNSRIKQAIRDGIRVEPGDSKLEQLFGLQDATIGRILNQDERIKQGFRQRFENAGVSIADGSAGTVGSATKKSGEPVAPQEKRVERSEQGSGGSTTDFFNAVFAGK